MIQDWIGKGSVTDSFGEGECLFGWEKISNGVEQRNKPTAPIESLGPPFLGSPGKVVWDCHSCYVPMFGGEYVAKLVAVTGIAG